MTTCEKPNHRRLSNEVVREWRTKTNTDRDKTICLYCDEDILNTKRNGCSYSCGTFDVWVDLTTFATINLDLDGVLK